MTEQVFTFTRFPRETNRNERDEMIKQAVIQAQASNAKKIFVSQEWMNLCKPAFTALCHPKKVHWDDYVTVECLGVTFDVSNSLPDPFSFRLGPTTTP